MASVLTYVDQKVSRRIVIEPKKARPFANDPDLRRTVNRLSHSGSQLAGWVSSVKSSVLGQ